MSDLATTKLIEMAERAFAQRDEAIKALEFYADRRRYQGANQQPIPNDPYAKPDAVYILDVTRDGGSIAIAAIARVSALRQTN